MVIGLCATAFAAVAPLKDPKLYGDYPPVDGLSDATPPSNPVRIAYERWDAHFWPMWDPKYRPGRIKAAFDL